MKRTKRVYVNVLGMDGYGSTKTEAKHDAERQIERALDGSYTPCVFRFPAGYIGIVSRTAPYLQAHSWEYCYLNSDETQLPAVPCTHDGYETKEATERALRLHIAKNLIFVTEENGLEVLVDETERHQHKAYIAWQLRYKEYRTQGYSDPDAYRLACESRAFCPTAA